MDNSRSLTLADVRYHNSDLDQEYDPELGHLRLFDPRDTEKRAGRNISAMDTIRLKLNQWLVHSITGQVRKYSLLADGGILVSQQNTGWKVFSSDPSVCFKIWATTPLKCIDWLNNAAPAV
jgi:hypothetical protein